jgi:plastocyanin
MRRFIVFRWSMERDLRMQKLRLAFHALGALFASATHAGPLELQVQGVDGKGIGATVVVLRSTDPARPLAKPVQATMDQRDKQFVPQVLVVPTGSKVIFPNKDTVQHQVFSNSRTKTFVLKLYRGTPEPQSFDRPGVVPVRCNIHDNMQAYVFVVDGQYFGRTDATGSWKVPDVQPGTYTVQVLHPLARNMKPVLEQKITVTATEPRAMLRLEAPLRLRTDSDVPGNWDAY